MKDFYYILGIEENATSLEIKGAYRKLSKKFHPDLNFNDKYFEKHFREIKEAYETLDDPGKRTQYDKKLSHFKSDPSYQHYAEDLKRREEELRLREEKIRFKQAYPHYYKSRKTPGKDTKRPATPGERSRIRKIDIGFTLVLIIITLIFGNYVMGVVNDAKTVKTKKTTPAVVADVPFLPVHYKRKHKLRQPATDDPVNTTGNTKKPPVKIIADDYKSAVAETKAEAAKAPDEEPVPVVTEQAETEPAPPPVANTVSYKPAPNPKGGILYATNIVSNVTGVTNMRRYDKYGSPIIKEIPTNSKVFVIQKGDIFYKVLCDNSTGYVPKWSLEEK